MNNNISTSWTLLPAQPGHNFLLPVFKAGTPERIYSVVLLVAKTEIPAEQGFC
jgi:hypothetical protein